MQGLFPGDWLASPPYEDVPLGVLKSGKESVVHLVARVGASRTTLLADKRFITRAQRAFRNDYTYAGVWGEGTRHENRAIRKRTRFGQQVLQSWWVAHEWEMLRKAYAAGITVPPPVERSDDGYVMAFIGDDGIAAPRLADVDIAGDVARRAWLAIESDIRRMLRADIVHGDLSPFNILWWRERPVIIDFSQSVDAITHPAARDLLRRDVSRTASHFRKLGIAIEDDAALAFVGDSAARFARQVLSS